MAIPIAIEVVQEILKLYKEGNPPFRIAEMLKVSSQTVCKKLRSSGYPRCVVCGKRMEDSRLSRLYCDECSKRMMSKHVMDYYKRRKDLEMSGLASNRWCDREMMDTHGDLHNLNSSVLGTGRLGPHRKECEADEVKVVKKEFNRLLKKNDCY